MCSSDGCSDQRRETTSIKSSIYRGLEENGRRYVFVIFAVAVMANSHSYQTLSHKEYMYGVSFSIFLNLLTTDQRPFGRKTIRNIRSWVCAIAQLPTVIIDPSSHLLALVMDSDRDNPLFYSPIGDNPTNILDLGTGQGNWAMYAPYLRTSIQTNPFPVMSPTCSHPVIHPSIQSNIPN